MNQISLSIEMLVILLLLVMIAGIIIGAMMTRPNHH